MELRVLGPVELWIAGNPLYLARRQQRLIIGILALEANRVVSSSRLVDFLWGSIPPKQARAVIQTRISELRGALQAAGPEPGADSGISTAADGYVLRVRPEQVDAHNFRYFLEQARAASSDEGAARKLREALELWRGPALGGWLPEHARATLTEGLESARLTAAEDLFEIELRRGNHRIVVDEILALSGANPTRERLAGQLMIALHRAGRSAEAVQAYDRYRRRLADDLGLDP